MEQGTAETTAVQHTPGPWRVGESAWVNGIVVWDADENIVADVLNADHVGTPFPEADANARLIAAAPQMLEALRLALAAMNYLGDELNEMDAATDEGIAEVTPAFDAIRGAIAAATGSAVQA